MRGGGADVGGDPRRQTESRSSYRRGGQRDRRAKVSRQRWISLTVKQAISRNIRDHRSRAGLSGRAASLPPAPPTPPETLSSHLSPFPTAQALPMHSGQFCRRARSATRRCWAGMSGHSRRPADVLGSGSISCSRGCSYPISFKDKAVQSLQGHDSCRAAKCAQSGEAFHAKTEGQSKRNYMSLFGRGILLQSGTGGTQQVWRVDLCRAACCSRMFLLRYM